MAKRKKPVRVIVPVADPKGRVCIFALRFAGHCARHAASVSPVMRGSPALHSTYIRPSADCVNFGMVLFRCFVARSKHFIRPGKRRAGHTEKSDLSDDYHTPRRILAYQTSEKAVT